MSNNTKISAIIPLRFISLDDASQKYRHEAIYILINHIATVGITINDQNIKIKTEINYTNKSDSYAIYSYIMKDWPHSVQYISLEFELLINNDLTAELLANYRNSICNQFSDLISELFLYLNISYPGCISFFDGVIFCDGNWTADIPQMNYSISESIDFSIGKKYPKIDQIDFLYVLSWIEKNNINIYNIPNCKIAQAINCLTHVCNSNSNTCEKLIFSIMALEILYTKGNTNLTEQLNEKIQLFLGPLSQSKKLIRNMYSIRSRFLHGDLPLASYTMYDNTFAKYEEEIYQSFNLSLSILLATLQKMIITDKKQLDFKLTFVD